MYDGMMKPGFRRLLAGLIFAALLTLAGGHLLWGQSEASASRETAITRAIRAVSPAVAGINVVKLQRGPNPYGLMFDDPFFSYMLPDIYRRVESLGSGLVISSDGYVVTNAHVVENAAEIIVTLPGGHQYDVKNIYRDPLTDLALLKIEALDLPAAKLGDSDNLVIGEWAIALGNPLGLFDVSKQPTATAGIISGLHMDFGHQASGQVYPDMIQTDASINQGNSGGPLVNADGEVIGINSFIFTGGQSSSGSIGIGFAIPINRVREIVTELKTKGRVDRSYATGLRVQAVNRDIQKYLKLPKPQGVLIKHVETGSAGDRAGLKVADVILSANGKPVNSTLDIKHVIDEDLLRAGDALDLRVWRDEKEVSVKLVLGKTK